MTDDALDEAAHRNLLEFCRESARWSGAHGAVREEDGALLLATGTTFPVLLNGAHRVDAHRDPAALLERADAWFLERGRGYTLWTRPGRDDDLAAAAEVARGAEAVTLQASAMGEPIYRRMGYETRYRYRTWLRRGPDAPRRA